MRIENKRGSVPEIAIFEECGVNPLPEGVSAQEKGVKRTMRMKNVGNSKATAEMGGGSGRESIQRINVDQIEVRDVSCERGPKGRRELEFVRARPTREVTDLDAAVKDGLIERQGSAAVSIHVGRVNRNLMT